MNYKKLLSIVAVAATMVGLSSCGSTDSNNDSMWSERVFTPGNYAGQITYNPQGVWSNYALNTNGQNYDGLQVAYNYDTTTGLFTGMVPSKVYNPVDYGNDFNVYPNWAGVIDLRNAGAEDAAPVMGDPFMMARFNPNESTSGIPSNPSVKLSFVTTFFPAAQIHAQQPCRLRETRDNRCARWKENRQRGDTFGSRKHWQLHNQMDHRGAWRS